MLRRQLLLAHYGVQLVLDVGANAGQYARQLRRGGYQHRIVSFEPQSSAFATCCRSAPPATRSGVHMHVALSDVDGTAQINLAGNSLSSSLLGMLPTHAESAPESTYVGSESVTTRRLDGLLPGLAPVVTATYLKIDTQGSELKVLHGAGAALQLHRHPGTGTVAGASVRRRAAVRARCWRGWPNGVTNWSGSKPAFSDPRSGRLLQADGFFHRSGGA